MPQTLLSDLTTMRVGGPAREYVAATSDEEIIEAVSRADAAGEPVLIIGSGSNMLVSDAGFPGLVVHDARTDIPPLFFVEEDPIRPASFDDDGTGTGDGIGFDDDGASSDDDDVRSAAKAPPSPVENDSARPAKRPRQALVVAVAGRIWDQLVADTVAAGFAGIEAMSGIPGTVGAAPVQNVGAYGQDISMTLFMIRAWDRLLGEVREFTKADLDFSYRNSLLKASMHEHRPGDPKSPWWPSPRYVVLTVVLLLSQSELSMPIQWEELAVNLGVGLGDRAPLAAVREEVLRLRAKRGTLVDGFGGVPVGNFDRWSVGSFFTNPILSVDDAERLPPEVPRFPLGEHEVGDSNATRVQVPAAWLIENAGFGKGFGLHGPESAATVSGLHCLALTNRGSATTADVVELARAVKAGVLAKYALELVPEPNLIGVQI